MKFRNHAFNHSVLLLVTVIFTTAIISCRSPEKDFEKAKSENTIEVYEDFIKKYPESEFVEEAHKIVCDLAFNEAKAKNTIEAFENYINKYPESDHIDEAKKMILDIAYNDALKENTIEVYENFIKKYPESEFVEEVHKIVCDLAFNEAKAKNTIEAFENYINKYPESNHIDEAKKMILDIAYNDALKENTIKAFNDFINTYNPNKEYISKINEKIRQKQEYLQLAIETHILAQQETDDEKIKQLFNKSEELFNKANFEEAMLDISSFPLLNLHLGMKSLKKILGSSFQITREFRGSSYTAEYEYSVKNEQLNTYTLYNLALASAGRTSFLMKVIVKRGNKELEICKNKFSINSKYYTDFSGLIKNNDFVLQKGDKIVLKTTASGNDYGTSCGNFRSFIKILKPKRTISDNVLSEKGSALSWIISNIKHNYPSSLLLSFIAEIDHCLLENKNGKWLLGWGNMKNSKPYKLKWSNNRFIAEKLTMEQAQDLGIKEFSLSFSID